MCIVLYFEIILFHFIWNNYFSIQNKINSENKYFPKNTVDTNPMPPPSHFNATGCRLWSTGSDRSQSSVVNSMQKGPSEIAVVKISRTEYITKCFRNMVDQIPQKRILRPRYQSESHRLQWPSHIWNSSTSGASRHHGAHVGTPAWTKTKPSSSGRSHLKTYRPVQVRIYTICVELAICVRKESVPQKFSF